MEDSFKIDLGQSWEIVVLMYMGTYKIYKILGHLIFRHALIEQAHHGVYFA